MRLPNKGDRVVQAQYGAGTVVEIDSHHTVIEFDTFATRRFITNLVVLTPTSAPAPSDEERRLARLARAREERQMQRAAAAPREKKSRRGS